MNRAYNENIVHNASDILKQWIKSVSIPNAKRLCLFLHSSGERPFSIKTELFLTLIFDDHFANMVETNRYMNASPNTP